MDITRKLLQDIRPEIDKALSPLAIKYGITIKATSGKFGGLEGSMKVTFSTTNKEGEDRKALDYKRYASLYNLKEEWLNKTFVSRGDLYTIIGLDTSKRKNVVVLRRERDGSIRIAPTRMAITHMTYASPPPSFASPQVTS
tara:strand:- start:301 stop:723 length:423 start_codon:yes stop_codon:yes gene_type:complete